MLFLVLKAKLATSQLLSQALYTVGDGPLPPPCSIFRSEHNLMACFRLVIRIFSTFAYCYNCLSSTLQSAGAEEEQRVKSQCTKPLSGA